MNETTNQPDPLFLQLVLSLQMGAWQQLGKIASPLTGKVERDLHMAKMTIDMLSMIQAKTAGNLNPDEKRMVDHILYELRLNYVDESSKGETPSDTSSGPKTQAEERQMDRPEEPKSDTTEPRTDNGTKSSD